MPPRKKMPRASREPASFDACMDAGVDQEERGERFSFGAKAQRHYGQALEWYEQAAAYEPTSVDARYNAARIYYTLGTQFLAPFDAREALVQACHLYIQALELAPIAADGIPSAARLDVLSNGGYALYALAELVDEFGCVDGQAACQTLAAPVVDAATLSMEMPVPLYVAAAHWFEQVALGQRMVLEAALMPTSAPQEAPQHVPPSESGGEEQSEFSSSLVAPASLIETWNDQIKCGLDLLPHAPDTSTLQGWVASLQSLISLAQSYVRALPEGLGDSQSPPRAWDRQVALLQQACIEVELAQVQRAVDWDVWPTVHEWEALEDAVLGHAQHALQTPPPAQSLTSVRFGTDAEARVEQVEAAVEDLCTLGNHAHALARLRIDCLISRTRASMYGELSSISLTRAHNALVHVLDVAQANQVKLLDNARIYARRALADDGLMWVHQVSMCPASEDTLVYGRALTHADPDGGWESLQRDLTLLVGC
ncbi:hypothetical protein MCAP1_000679 [Malassezia caprae]|uniref:Uncharacterized protein n=1 Tax=Malassezia caprae TaxID=1381934 RepID=A0AAF0E5A9_9BASI|nr:hypothetical protein MCAP1_000679 [Malassezia caprae]